ncbi:hypothetical protein MKX01_028429 [Papaver californicum]|nr:hypothetical protein MKX01_028429 [Papaver californicum]
MSIYLVIVFFFAKSFSKSAFLVLNKIELFSWFQSAISDQTLPWRRKLISTILITSSGICGGLQLTPLAVAQAWGTRSFIKERFSEPELSLGDAVARIRQTAEGLHGMREMLDTMSWGYVIFYIRLKQTYVFQDDKNAMMILPESSRNTVTTPNSFQCYRNVLYNQNYIY